MLSLNSTVCTVKQLIVGMNVVMLCNAVIFTDIVTGALLENRTSTMQMQYCEVYHFLVITDMLEYTMHLN
jgi:hypothetical protein